jgi:hypothetical protein
MFLPHSSQSGHCLGAEVDSTASTAVLDFNILVDGAIRFLVAFVFSSPFLITEALFVDLSARFLHQLCY